MTFPGGIALTTVEEDYFGQSGTTDPIEASGTVTFTPGSQATDPIYINVIGAGIFVPVPVVGTVDPATGLVSVDLIPEDAAGIEPTGFSYHVQEDVTITAGTQTIHFGREYDITVPTSVDPVRLSAIAPTAPSDGAVTLVLSVNGHAPDVAGNVDVLWTDVRPATGIPETDLDTATQGKIDAAGRVDSVVPTDTTITVDATDPANPKIKVGTAVPQSAIAGLPAALAALYTKPATGIPETDLAAAVQTLIDGAEQTNRKNVAGGYAGTDATNRVLAAHAPLAAQVQDVAFATPLVVDATTGTTFRVTVTAAFTLGKPTGLLDGQLVLFEFTQDAVGGHVITLDPAYNLGSKTVALSAGAGAVDKLLVQYRAAADKLDVLEFGAGY